jgi:hypothetical protein
LILASAAVLPSLCSQVPIKAVNKSIIKTKKKKKEKKGDCVGNRDIHLFASNRKKGEREKKRTGHKP